MVIYILWQLKLGWSLYPNRIPVMLVLAAQPYPSSREDSRLVAGARRPQAKGHRVPGGGRYTCHGNSNGKEELEACDEVGD